MAGQEIPLLVFYFHYFYHRFYNIFSDVHQYILITTPKTVHNSIPSEEAKNNISIQNSTQSNADKLKVLSPIFITTETVPDNPNSTLNKTTINPTKPETEKATKVNFQNKFNCSVCSRSFPYLSTLKVHLLSHPCLELPRFCCPKCPQTFSRQSGLRAHQRLHTGERPFICSTCKRAFAAKSNLTIHQRAHSTERPFPCGYCKKAFRYRKGLLIHEDLVHKGTRPFGCRQCGEKFDRISKLKHHQRAKHAGQ